MDESLGLLGSDGLLSLDELLLTDGLPKEELEGEELLDESSEELDHDESSLELLG